MQKIIYNKTGEEAIVENNIAHGLVEKGIARLKKVKVEVKEISEPPKDKMMKKGRNKLRTK